MTSAPLARRLERQLCGAPDHVAFLRLLNEEIRAADFDQEDTVRRRALLAATVAMQRFASRRVLGCLMAGRVRTAWILLHAASELVIWLLEVESSRPCPDTDMLRVRLLQCYIHRLPVTAETFVLRTAINAAAAAALAGTHPVH